LEIILVTGVVSAIVGVVTQGLMLWARVAIEKSERHEQRAQEHAANITVSRVELDHLSQRVDEIYSEVRRLRETMYESVRCRAAPEERAEDHAA
jgi:flagellar biosynthesis/type III secretory pathway chaperone